MQINSSTAVNTYLQNTMSETDTKTLKEKIQSGEVSAKAISQAYLVEYSLKVQSYSSDNIKAQNATLDLTKIRDILKNVDFNAIGYSGKPITDLTPDEAKALVSEEGYFGVPQTSARLSDFVLNAGGDDLEKLRAGREGIIRGFTEAEKLWGGKLPDISYETLDKALAKIDEKITALGGNVLDTKA